MDGSSSFKPCTEEQLKRCTEMKRKVCTDKYPFVWFMMQQLKKIGCEVNVDRHIVCEQCPINGAFDAASNEVVLCENNIVSPGHMAEVLTHELIHAYDHCRARVDFKNIKHLACTEVRAASLSGDCTFSNEFFNRFNFNIKKQHQICVRRRASLSLQTVLGVSQQAADDAVDAVYDTCFLDTAPFDRIP